jgi:hypothetical protein
MRFLVAFLLLAHGIAHLVGFAATWKLGEFSELPYKTTVLSGSVDLGDGGIRLMGVAWVLLAVAFAAAAVGLALRQPWWSVTAWWGIGFSGLVCALNFPEARIGLAFNGLLVVLLVLLGRFNLIRPA